MTNATRRQRNWNHANRSRTTPTQGHTASAAPVGRLRVAVCPLSMSLCFKCYSSLSSEGTGLRYTPCFCGRKAQCKSLPGGLVVRNGAPHTGTGENILGIAHSLMFMESQNHRTVWVGRELQRSSSPPPPPAVSRGIFNCIRVLRAPSNLAWNVSRDGGINHHSG